MGPGVIAVPVYRNWNRVVLETDRFRYELGEVGQKHLILPVSGKVKFYRDGDWFIMLDSKNKKHKFSLMHLTSKQPN
jgi:hypothetical protein